MYHTIANLPYPKKNERREKQVNTLVLAPTESKKVSKKKKREKAGRRHTTGFPDLP